MIQRKPSFLRSLKHGHAVALDIEDTVPAFNQVERDVVTIQPTLEFGYQTGSLRLEFSVGTPRNPNVECQFRHGFQVNIYDQFFNGCLIHCEFPVCVDWSAAG